MRQSAAVIQEKSPEPLTLLRAFFSPSNWREAYQKKS